METLEQILHELQQLRRAAGAAPTGLRNKIQNRCSRITILIKKEMNEKQKYIARAAIYEAMTNGRKLSQMDCREFEVEDMRTPISHMKDRFHSNGYRVESQWIKTPKGRRIKEYWLERLHN